MRRTIWMGAMATGLVFGCSHAGSDLDVSGSSATPAPSAALTVARHKPYDQLTPIDAPLLRFQYTPEELTGLCEKSEVATDAALAQLVAVAPAQRTFDNTFKAFEDAIAEYLNMAGRLTFMKDVHTDEKVRAAASQCEERVGKYLVRISARKDLFLAMKGYADTAGKTDELDEVDQRLIFLTLRDFRRSGLELSDADLAKLVKMRSRSAELSTQFASHLAENVDSIEATKAELAGLPKDLVDRLKKTKGGKYLITTKYPDYYPTMEGAKSEVLRRRMDLAFNSREAQRNLPLLTEAIAIRDESARLLGYANHADYVTEERMAKSSKTVAEFLGKLREELKPGRDALNQKLLALKVAETKNPKAQLNSWDWRYYLKQLKKRDYNLDDEKVRAYFPAEKVISGMFDVYSRLLQISFHEVPNAEIWATGVKLYEVKDVASGKKVARFYTDFFPRPGKYGHAACFGVAAAREVTSGYQTPLAVLVVNFNPPQPGKGAFLSMTEVETLFHEFGHVMHGALTTAPYMSMSGTNVATDFVEAPSQMLENWAYQPEVLKLISTDPADPSKPMPGELADRLVAARTYDSGIRYTRQNYLASLDQALHTSGAKVDPDAIERATWGQIMGYPEDPAAHSVASFGHIMGGYDAGYYGYLWSQVFATDMFTRFEKEGVLNGDTGKAYRDIILASGKTVDPEVLLRRFLGRDPNEKAFLRIMGVTPQAAPATTVAPGSKAIVSP